MLPKLVYALTIAALLAAVRAAQPVIQHLPPDATATPTFAETVPPPGYTPVVRTATPRPSATPIATPTGWKDKTLCLNSSCVTPPGLP